jgi:16S rRNA (guanine1207-N2)-methyltransferase
MLAFCYGDFMTHYFTNDDIEKRVYERVCEFGGREFRFATSDGVFSKGSVDEGTAWLLTAVLPLINDGGIVADFGCGYGVLGIVIAALMPRTRCFMFDINIKAVELANINAARNNVGGRAVVSVSDGLPASTEPADYVVTNPPVRAGKQTVLRFFTESHTTLRPGGSFFAVLRKQQGAESYIKAVAEIFGNCETLLKKKGYIVVKAVKI